MPYVQTVHEILFVNHHLKHGDDANLFSITELSNIQTCYYPFINTTRIIYDTKFRVVLSTEGVLHNHCTNTCTVYVPDNTQTCISLKKQDMEDFNENLNDLGLIGQRTVNLLAPELFFFFNFSTPYK